MAALIKRGEVWYVAYYPMAGGNKKWVKGYTDKGETKKLAHRLEHEKASIANGSIDPDVEAKKVERAKDITAHITAYEDTLNAKGASGNHVSYTIADIRKLVAFGGVKNAAEISWNLVDRWVLSLKSADSARTINRRVGSVKAFLKHLQTLGALTTYVLHKYPKQATEGTAVRKSRGLSRQERDALLKAAPEDRRELYRFALYTGFRFNEIQSMTPSSLNFDRGTIMVRASDAKNKSKDQVVPMASCLVKPLRKLAKGKAADDALFGGLDHAAEQVRADAVAAGLKDTDAISFHGLRHTFITLLAESNIHPKTLQELARHSDLETTLRYYVHFKEETTINAIEGL